MPTVVESVVVASAFGGRRTRFFSSPRPAAFVFSAVVLLTGGRYLGPTPFSSVEQLLQHQKIDQVIGAKVQDGDTVCIQDYRPLGFFYSSMFHQPRVYKVLEVHPEDEIPSGCDVVLQSEVAGDAG